MSIKCASVQFNINECTDRAVEIFLKETGLDSDDPKYEGMRSDAFDALDQVKPGIDIRATYTYYNKMEFRLSGDKLIAAGTQISCPAFAQIAGDSIYGLYVYGLSAGDYTLKAHDGMAQIYADLWGNAFTDAARDMLIQELQNFHVLSDSFGPGFYGMDIKEILNIRRLVDLSAAGISITDNGLMRPAKSCAGIFFCVNSKYRRLNSACQTCLGNGGGCRFCILNK